MRYIMNLYSVGDMEEGMKNWIICMIFIIDNIVYWILIQIFSLE